MELSNMGYKKIFMYGRKDTGCKQRVGYYFKRTENISKKSNKNKL